MTYKGEPICLDSGYLDITPGGGGVTADSELLNNNFSCPIVIDEIRFITRYYGSTVMNSGNSLNGSVRVRLRFGSFEITNGLVPVWSFGPVISDAGNAVSAAAPEYCRYGEDSVGVTSVYAHYRWPLPKPLFARPGDGMIANFIRTSDGFSNQGQVAISLAGRRLPVGTPPPSHLDVPYVTSWQSTISTDNTVSGENDLWNKFDYPIYVQQFTGRLWNFVSGTTTKDDISGLCPASSVDPSPAITMNITRRGPAPFHHPHVQTVVRDPTPIGAVFDVNRRTWVIGKTLEAKEGFQVKLSASSGGMANRSLHLGMIAHRKERIA